MTRTSLTGLLCIIVVFGTSNLYGLSLGSLISASSQTYNIFTSGDTNTIVGFAKIEEGFSFLDAATSCTFNAFFPLSGTVFLNGGRLTLAQDLLLDSQSVFLGGGRIEGNDNSVYLPKQRSYKFPHDNSQIAITDSETIATSDSIADARSLDWSYDDAYIAMGRRSTSEKELTLTYFDGTTLTTTIEVEHGLEVSSVRWHPTKRYLAVGRGSSAGDELLIYEHKVYNGTLSQVSGDEVGALVTACAWHPSGSYLIAGTTNDSKELLVYPVDANGNLGTEAVVDITTNSNINRDALSFAPGGNKLAVGTTLDASGYELLIYDFNGALALDTSLEIGYNVQSVDWSPTGSYIAVGLTGGKTNVQVYDVSSGTLSQVSNATINQYQEVYNVQWDKTGNYLLVALNDQNPAIADVFYVYYFNKVTKTLTQIFNDVSDDEAWAARWSRNGNHCVYAIRETNQKIRVSSFVTGRQVLIKDGALVFNADSEVTTQVHFAGTCKVNAKGKRLTFDSASQIVVRRGASLVIENADLTNLYQSSLRCLDDSGSITLRNCQLRLSNNLTFSHGGLIIEQDVQITGTNNFNYTSGVTSTIAAASQLIVDTGVTFKYDPNRGRQDLLYMTDQTSVLALNGCTLHSTQTGLWLKNGTVLIDDRVTLSSDAVYPAEALRFDSTMPVIVRANAQAEVFGFVRYD